MNLTINSVTGRTVQVTAAWDNDGDPISAEFGVPNVRVENFTEAVQDIYAYVTAMYEGEKNKRLAYLAANPTAALEVLAAVGQTFNDAAIAAVLQPVGIEYA